jgi:hypothetical protein
VETIIQREQGVPPKGDFTASSSSVSTVEVGFFGPVGTSVTEVRFFHFSTVFGLIP